jgi:hypothetical protein
MPKEHDAWRLYSRTVHLSPHVEKVEYFFGQRGNADATPADPPVGYRVAISPKTGLPFLERLKTLATE